MKSRKELRSQMNSNNHTQGQTPKPRQQIPTHTNRQTPGNTNINCYHQTAPYTNICQCSPSNTNNLKPSPSNTNSTQTTQHLLIYPIKHQDTVKYQLLQSDCTLHQHLSMFSIKYQHKHHLIQLSSHQHLVTNSIKHQETVKHQLLQSNNLAPMSDNIFHQTPTQTPSNTDFHHQTPA